jgi:hypothetical protein
MSLITITLIGWVALEARRARLKVEAEVDKVLREVLDQLKQKYKE